MSMSDSFLDGNDGTDLIGDPIDPNRLVEIYAGRFRYRFDSAELTKVLLTSSNNKNPYTGIPLWKTREEYEAYFSSNISAVNKIRLDHKFYNAAFEPCTRQMILMNIEKVRNLLTAAKQLETFHYAFGSKEYRKCPKKYVEAWFMRRGMCGIAARTEDSNNEIRSGDFPFEPHVPSRIFDVLQLCTPWLTATGMFYIRENERVDAIRVIIDATKSGRGNEIIDMFLTFFYHLEIPTNLIETIFVNLGSRRVFATCYGAYCRTVEFSILTVAHVINDKFLFENTTDIVDIADNQEMTFSTPKTIEENFLRPLVLSTPRSEYMHMNSTLRMRIEK